MSYPFLQFFPNSFLISVRALVQNSHLLKVFIVGVLFLFTVVGCGKKGPTVAIVSGTVLLDGEPLDGASVIFHPASSSGLAGSGRTSLDGTFGAYDIRCSLRRWCYTW
jgi:hypothetical protein